MGSLYPSSRIYATHRVALERTTPMEQVSRGQCSLLKLCGHRGLTKLHQLRLESAQDCLRIFWGCDQRFVETLETQGQLTAWYHMSRNCSILFYNTFESQQPPHSLCRLRFKKNIHVFPDAMPDSTPPRKPHSSSNSSVHSNAEKDTGTVTPSFCPLTIGDDKTHQKCRVESQLIPLVEVPDCSFVWQTFQDV